MEEDEDGMVAVGEEEGDDEDDVVGDDGMQSGLIQKARVPGLPFLEAPPCWSGWVLSSLLSQGSLSFCRSLSTRSLSYREVNRA